MMQEMLAGDMPPQVFIGTRPERKRFDDPSSGEAWRPTKPFGGIWTSPLESTEPTWIDTGIASLEDDVGWENRQHYRYEHLWLLPVSRRRINERVLLIDNMDDIFAVTERYGVPTWLNGIRPDTSIFANERGLDFVKILADGYAGVHVSFFVARAHLWVWNEDRPYVNFDGWDCVSTVWLKWIFGQPTRIARSTEEYRAYIGKGKTDAKKQTNQALLIS